MDTASTSKSPRKQMLRFPIEQIIDHSVTDFDLFVMIEGHMVLYAPQGYRWNREEIQALMANGNTHLLMNPEDQHKAQVYLNICKLPQIEKELAPAQRIQSIQEVGRQFLQALYGGEITSACVEKARDISSTLVDCISEDVGCIAALSGLSDHDHYTYEHSMRVASFTVAICVEMGLSQGDALKEIALGGIFHDIGKKQVPLSIINKAGSLTDQEWAQMKAHPESGLVILKESLLGHVPREIILHHHEKRDGSGYPHQLDHTSLLYEVQVATLADVYDALTSTRSYQVRRNRFEALELIKSKMLGSKIAHEPFKALISCLVKPNKNAA